MLETNLSGGNDHFVFGDVEECDEWNIVTSERKVYIFDSWIVCGISWFPI